MQRLGWVLVLALLLGISTATAGAQNVSGTGPEATDLFPLPAGLTTFDLEYDGEGSFTVRLLDDQEELVEQLASGKGRYRSSKSVLVPRTGQYFYDISATGSWVIRVRQPTREEAAADQRARAGDAAVGHQG